MAGNRFSSLAAAPRAYVAAVTLAGASTVAISAAALFSGAIPPEWLILALLTLISASAPIRLHSIPVALSVSETFVFTSAILFGPAAATLTVVLDAAVISFWSFRRGQKLYKIAFNVCALPLTIWVAAHVFFAIASFEPLFRAPTRIDLQDLLWPLLLCTITYFVLSSWIITLAIALERGVPPFTIWRDNFAWISLNYFGGASVAALIVSYTNDLNFTFLVIIVALLPLLAIIYATYSRRVGRVQDANQHLMELNSLYVSTIETLAMAIDAKDQVTHGHIRRVQSYAVGLARHLGVSDHSLIQAIEAAALLHDMGKLAVPEYILNKPGPLTPAEFDRMKLHASIGADILSSINFPYPVVPIVRHHHENWDGSGYPDGLKGTEIPLGARILSVVDCYDALTSDRPYRPRLADEDATRILLERRGVMYDPVIVDTFLSVHAQLAGDASSARTTSELGLIGLQSNSDSLSDRLSTSTGLSDIAASNEEMVALYELAHSLIGLVDFTDAAEIISKHLRRIVPASTCVIFLYDAEKDDLVAAHAAGDNASHLIGIRIPRGQRLTGWVAANRRSILNSDPVLDLGEASRHLKPRLRSCLSTPLLSDGQLVGVLTVYSTLADGFTEDHRRLLEVIGKQVAETVRHAQVSFGSSSVVSGDEVSGFARRERVERLVAAEVNHSPTARGLSIVVLRTPRTSDHARNRGVNSERMNKVVSGIRRLLRGADIICRYSDQEVVVVLTETDAVAASSVAARVAQLVRECGFDAATADHAVGFATAPSDGSTLAELVQSAQRRIDAPASQPLDRPPAIH
jgi:putative nucleotidyltransferase with HDIG domain